jgi:uncharacterized membrane protein
MKLGHKLRRVFLVGVFTAIPVYITIKVLQALFEFMENILAPLVDGFLGFHIPGLSTVLLIVSLFILGLLITNFLGRRLYHLAEAVIYRVPIVSNVYNTAKQIVLTFSPEHRQAFQKVVWLQYPRLGIWTLGFVTGRTVSADGVDYYNVFIATTPVPTSGIVIFAPVKDTLPANMSVEDGFKLLISGGALHREHYNFLYELTPDAIEKAHLLATADRVESKPVRKIPGRSKPEKPASEKPSKKKKRKKKDDAALPESPPQPVPDDQPDNPS